MLVNPKFIGTIQKIFQTEQLTFSFSQVNKGILVYPHYDCGMFAVLMPMTIDVVEPRYCFTLPVAVEAAN